MREKEKTTLGLPKHSQSFSDIQSPELEESYGLNQLLLDSLPHPAMVIERDRKVVAANRIAREFGACVGGYCWRDFARSEYISEDHKAFINGQRSDILPDQIKCTFCLADEALEESKPTNAPEINAFGRIWDTWWIPIDAHRYLHYAIDITNQKQIEKELSEHRNHLDQMVDERTKELKAVNEQLKLEISGRMQIESALCESEERFRSMFEKSSAIKLLIDPVTGHIVDANPAAFHFYGYSRDQLKTMNISDINTLSPEEISAEAAQAAEEKRSHFFFKHRLASGDIRQVEVHTSPIPSNGQTLLFSIIHDITERRHTEELLKLEHSKFLSIANSTENAVFIIDDQYEIQYLNPTAERSFGPAENHKCYEYFHDSSKACPWCKKHEINAGKAFRRVWAAPRDHRTYDVYEAPFQNPDGTTSKLKILHEVTKHKQIEEALRLNEARLQALLDLSHMTRSPTDEIADFVLEQAVKLTKSKLGTLVMLNENETPCSVFSWSKNDTNQFVKTEKFSHFPLGDASFWEKAIHEREPIIENDYFAMDSRATDHPGSDTSLSRLLITPAVAEGRVMAIAATANKEQPYESADARQLSLLLDGLCKLIQRKQSEDALRESEKQLRYLSTKLLTLQEQEKELLAKELHDKVGQTFAAIKFGLETALKVPRTKALQAPMNSLESLLPVVQKSIEDVRKMYTELRPTILDDFGAIAAVGWLCREFVETYSNIDLEKHLEIDEADVPQNLKIIIFRVAQEVLKNIARHSQASLVNIWLTKAGGKLNLTIEDDGLGFELKQTLSANNLNSGVGLVSIKELTELSGGSFTIESVLGGGTTISASWPRAN